MLNEEITEQFSAEEQEAVARPPKEPVKDTSDTDEVKPEPKVAENQEQKTEEVKEPQVKERKPPKNPNAQVPIQALHEARKQIDEWRAKYEELSKRQPQKVEDVKADPVAAVEYLQHKDETDAVARQLQAKHEEFQREFINTYATAAREFAKETTDFGDAYRHLYDIRVDQLETLGFSREDAVKMAENEEKNIVLKAFNDGVNPAERLYALSIKMGYAKKQEAPKETSKVLEKLDTIEKGVKAANSLSSAAGSAESPPSLKAILDMDEDELMAMDKKAFRRAMGG